ncbi:MAG: RluA family pseudouridine synthase [Ruminococcaceae bacterium]|nr:RluA family pseudouridine synthase [Oscillospiraceae bacterium]
MNKFSETYLENERSRIDVFVSQICDVTRSRATKLITEGFVLINQKNAVKSDKLQYGDVVDITIPDPVELDVIPQNLDLKIIYEDDDLLVVNKPKGMVVHPAAGNFEGTLVNGLLYHCKDNLSGINGVMRPGIVHRIDKNTSGLLMVAKNDNSHNFLAKQISEHTFTREYEAVVYGNVKQDNGTVNAPIGRHPIKRKQMAVTNTASRNAVTHFEVIERFGNFTHLKLRLETGRTHQIRVHMAYIGHPVAGDDVYGPKKVITELSGQCLHAKKIGFIHPTKHEYLEFDSNLPEYFEKFLRKLKNGNF